MPSRAALYLQQTTTPFYGPARPTAPSRSQHHHKRRLAILRLQKQPYFDQQYASMMSELSSRATVEHITTNMRASTFFSSTWPSIVLVTDPALASPSNYQLLEEARNFVECGGTLILCCHFASLIHKQYIDKLFSSFGLYWRSGDQHRTEHTINAAVHGFNTASLASTYSQQALHLRDVDSKNAVYLPTAAAYVQSHICPPSPIEDRSQTPAAFARYGKGTIGYLGDVNLEAQTLQTLLAMCGLH